MANPFPRDFNRVPVIGAVDSSTGLATTATIDHATGGLDVNIVGGGGTGGNVTIISPLGSQVSATSVSVVIASDQGAVPVSVSGVATSANQTNGTQQTKITDGTNVVGVLKNDGTVASAQNAELIAGTYLSVPISVTSTGAVGTTDAGNYKSVSVHITSVGTGGVANFQVSDDNTNWVVLPLQDSTINTTQTSNSVNSGTKVFYGNLTGRYFRLNITGLSGGTLSGTVVFSTLPTSLHTMGVTAAQSGTWTVGGLGNFNAASLNAGFPMGANGSTAVPAANGADTREIQLWADRVGRLHIMGDTAGTAVISNPVLIGLSDATNLQSALQAANALNSTGVGIQTAQMIAQLDDTTPTTITENQFGNVRMDGGRQLRVNNQIAPDATALNTYSVHLTGNATTTPTSSTAYVSSVVISNEVGGTTSTVTIQDKQGTPLKLVNGLATTALTTAPTVINFQTPVKMVSGIDIITAGAVAATIDVWINYYQ